MNLFAKIFLGFWVSTAAIIASWLLASQYFNPYSESVGVAALPPPASGRPGAMPPGRPHPGQPLAAPPRNMFRIYYGLQNVSADALRGWIRGQEKQEDIDIRLIDANGREIFDRELLPGTDKILQRLSGFRRRATLREDKLMLPSIHRNTLTSILYPCAACNKSPLRIQ